MRTADNGALASVNTAAGFIWAFTPLDVAARMLPCGNYSVKFNE
jgi:hypothetical protein